MSTRKNAAYNIAYRIFSVLLPLVTAPYLSRVVGREGVGLYAYAWSISYIFCLVGKLGLDDYGVREIAKVRDERDRLDRTFSEIWRMQLLVAGAVLLVWLGYVAFVAGEEKKIAFHLTMMSVSCLCSFDWCLMGLDQFRPVALRNTAVKLLAAAAVFLFIKGPEDLWIYGFVWSLSTLLGNISCVTSLRGRVRLVPVTWRDALKHLPGCSVLFISVIAVNVYRTMDKIMLGSLSTMAENGLYENAEKIIYCLSGFISAIGTVMMPKVTHMQKQGRVGEVRQHIDRTMELILCMVCAMAFGIAAIAREFAPLFFGEEFARSGDLMIPLSMTLIMIGFANVIRTQWILPQSRDTIFVRSVVCGAVVNLLINALLIPRFGAAGAVAGTLAAELTVPVVQWVILRRELPYLRYLKYLLLYAAAGGIMLAAVRAGGALIPLTGWGGIAVRVAIGAAVYGLLCLGIWRVTGNPVVARLLRKVKK